MKYLYKIIVSLLVVIVAFSCDEDDNFTFEQAEASFLIEVPSSGSNIVLDRTNPNNQALTVTWEDTQNAGVSYTIEFAKAATDFSESFSVGTTDLADFTLSVEELNTFLVNTVRVPQAESSGLDVRVVTSNGDISNTVSLSVTPFVIEVTELFVNGTFTNWDPAQGLPMNSSEFNIFTITFDLLDGDEFNFIPSNTSDEVVWQLIESGSSEVTKFGGVNLSGYTAGKYEITVDLNTNTFTIEEIIAPESLFLVGSLTGWDPATSLPFFSSAENVFTIVADLPDGAEFKFLPQNTGWDGDWGEDPSNPGGIIQDGEQNISGVAAGKYLITVDFNTLTYNLSSVDNLFLVGSLTGWDPATSLPMKEASLGVFSTVIDLPDGAEFKFLPQNTGWDGDWGEDPNNSGRIIQDQEQNLSGFAAGKYVVAVNFNTLSYTVSWVSEIPANLYLVGAFNGWSNDASNPQFTETSTGVFEITQALSANDEFKFVPVAGDWGNDWGESQASSGVLEQNSEQNIKVTNSGTYTIIVNFNNGTISVN